MTALNARPRRRTAAQVVQEVLEREAHLDFVVPRARHVAAHRAELGAGALGIVGARHLLVPVGAVHQDVRYRGQRLDVVDRRRLAEHARHCAGNGGLMRGLPRFPSMEFMRAVSSPQMYAPAPLCTYMSIRSPRAHRVAAEDARGVRASAERRLHALERLGELAADVDVASSPRRWRRRRDGAPFDQSVRGPPHDLAVLERAGLRFVGVAAEVVRLAVADLHERPLQAGREAGPAAPAQPGFLHDVLRSAAGSMPSACSSARYPPRCFHPSSVRASASPKCDGQHERLAGMRFVRIAHDA